MSGRDEPLGPDRPIGPEGRVALCPGTPSPTLTSLPSGICFRPDL
jgi:hypothetical protein